MSTLLELVEKLAKSGAKTPLRKRVGFDELDAAIRDLEWGSTGTGPDTFTPTDTEAFRKYYNDSVARSDSRASGPRGALDDPRVLYHAGPDPIFEFSETAADRTDPTGAYARFGYHLGARNQALSRATHSPTTKDKPFYMNPSYASIKNPVRLDENREGRWGPTDVLNQLMSRASKAEITGVPERDIEAFYDDAFKFKTREPFMSLSSVPQQRDSLRGYLDKIGYDGIVYDNKYEGIGDSYIALRPQQIKSIFNRGTWDATDPRTLYGAAPLATVGGQDELEQLRAYLAQQGGDE